jgi:imidazolonepropionase-like amidohydrolase
MAYGNSNQPVEETLWIQNATLWTCGPAGVLESGEIIIHKGVIVAVGEQLDLASIFGAKSNIRPVVMDARGMHITPGIIDEHSHIAVSRGINEGTQASSAEVEIGSAINSEDINIYRQLAGGVTTSQLLHGSANPIGGQSALIKLRWGEDADGLKFEDAPGFIKFALGENVKQSNWGDDYRSRFPQTRMGVEQVYYDLFIQAMEYKSRWQQYERERSNLSLRARWRGDVPVAPRRDLEMETLVEILDGQRHITCHSYRQDEINMLMHVADSLGFKINTFTHILEGYKVADKLAAHGAGGSTFSDWWAYKYEVKDAIPYNGAVLHGQGVVTAINSDDDEMARRLNQEAAKAVKYGGVSEEEALKFVTLNPAKLLRIDDRVGSLEVGKDADLVVWNDHPLSMYAQVQQTFIDGCRYFDVAEDQAKRAWMKSERARLMEAMQSPDHASGEKRQPAERIRPDYHCDTLTDENK